MSGRHRLPDRTGTAMFMTMIIVGALLLTRGWLW